MKKILFILLLFPALVSAQPWKFPGVDSSVRVHGFLMSRIDSSKIISISAKDTVLITNGSATGFAKIQGKPVSVVMCFFAGNIESPFEVFEYDTTWSGSGANPDTMRLIERNLLNSTAWSPHVWDTGTYIYVDPTLTTKALADSINYGLTHLNMSNVTSGILAPVSGGSIAPLGGNTSVSVGVGTYYVYPIGTMTAGATLTSMTEFTVPRNGYLRYLYVGSAAAAGAGQTTTFTVYQNGSPTGLLAIITGGSSVTANNTSSTISVSAGDLISMQIITSALSAATGVTWTFTYCMSNN